MRSSHRFIFVSLLAQLLPLLLAEAFTRAVACGKRCRSSSAPPTTTTLTNNKRLLSPLHESSSSTTQPDYEVEETLLKMNLSVQPGVSLDNALATVSKYCQSFPFAAVLPVQPLQYLPTDDDGVEIKFLRKKTDLKSGIDGGIRFFVHAVDRDKDNVEDEQVVAVDKTIDVTAKRNSVGQSIRKIMAEKLVVTAFVAGMTGEETEKYGKAPLDVVRVTSLFHKWM